MTTRRRGDDVPPCTQCGQRHLNYQGIESCHGHVTRDRDAYVPGQDRPLLDQPRPCRRLPTMGVTNCDSHGSSSPIVKAAAERRTQRAEAVRLMMTLGEPVEGSDPGEVIAERIDARRGHVRWLLARVQALEPDALTWGLTKRKTAVERAGDKGANNIPADVTSRFAGTDEGDTHEAKPHVWYALYTESAEKLERLCIEAIRVGLDERRVRMDERVADHWVQAIDRMLVALGHDPNDPAVAETVAVALELVAA